MPLTWPRSPALAVTAALFQRQRYANIFTFKAFYINIFNFFHSFD